MQSGFLMSSPCLFLFLPSTIFPACIVDSIRTSLLSFHLDTTISLLLRATTSPFSAWQRPLLQANVSDFCAEFHTGRSVCSKAAELVEHWCRNCQCIAYVLCQVCCPSASSQQFLYGQGQRLDPFCNSTQGGCRRSHLAHRANIISRHICDAFQE